MNVTFLGLWKLYLSSLVLSDNKIHEKKWNKVKHVYKINEDFHHDVFMTSSCSNTSLIYLQVSLITLEKSPSDHPVLPGDATDRTSAPVLERVPNFLSLSVGSIVALYMQRVFHVTAKPPCSIYLVATAILFIDQGVLHGGVPDSH